MKEKYQHWREIGNDISVGGKGASQIGSEVFKKTYPLVDYKIKKLLLDLLFK